MRNKWRRNIALSDEAWEILTGISKDLGISKSALIEMLIHLMKRSETATIPQMIDAVVQQILEVKEGKLVPKE